MQLPAKIAFAFVTSGLVLLTQLNGCASPGRVATAAMPCPPWVEFPAEGYDQQDPVHLGCVNALNLRNMVANPADLLHGQALGPASGERESLAVERYNQGKVREARSSEGAAPTIIMPVAGESANP